MPNTYQLATLSPGVLYPSLALATCRAGELSILDFEYVTDYRLVSQAVKRLNDTVLVPFALRLDGDNHELLSRVIEGLPNRARSVVLTSARPDQLREQVRLLREKNVSTLLEVSCLDHAIAGEAIGIDGLIAKGHEAGGRVADETTFILLQRFKSRVRVPVWAYGGIGLHTAGACIAAGAAGLIFDTQMALTRESPFSESLKATIAKMDGSETLCLGNQLGETYRVYYRPGNPLVKELQQLESRLVLEEGPRKIQAEWRQAIATRAGWDSEQNLLLVGQDAAFAAPLAERFRTVAGVLQGIRDAIRTQCEAAVTLRPLDEKTPLALSNGTRYPILQGPMTRVSDVPEFATRVAEGGALPFLALALMRAPEVKRVLDEAQRRLGTLPWGVGILGFVPPELRQEQMDVIAEYRPPFALIAGGRPDQARALEQKGITSYLHVPSPGLLRLFIQQGARRFVFEGRECGGHVGPRTSFVLWNQMVEVLLNAPELTANPEQFHIVFAAGVHDALSAAMVSVISAPLAERGVRVGVLLGTAYLFTEEAVATGAILETFQEQARECRNTVLLETGPGHSTRCVDTPYATSFLKEKRRLLTSGRPPEEIRNALEELNLGRLRIASKGVTRDPHFGQDPKAQKLVGIDRNQQLAEGMYMIGQVAALRQNTCTIQALHHDVSVEGSKLLEVLAGRSWEVAPQETTESPSDIAIVGMACLLPKAPNLQTYWDNILQKVNAVGEIPKDRFDWELYFDTDPKTKDKIYSRWGGFLDDTAFDPVQYGMPPASLRSIEPAQLLTLEVVRAALADAGYLGRPFPRERTSVILGAGGGAADLGLGYGARSFLPVLENLPEFRGRTTEILDQLDGRLPEWTEDSFAGILTNVSAGRVANRFDLGGSNYTVDAACASSLAAVSLALKELEGRTSDMVIVGGIDTMQNPFTYLCFSKTHALSPRGRCRTFDESADGIAISEGIVMMVFKRLADAERDADRIYAVIKGAGSSSDGKDRGLTAPRPEGQARALKRAYKKAGVSPATVGLVEAHGTGTVAGDGAEVQALTEVFSDAEAPRQGCAIGSVKSMIGHTKCSAGAAGLAKAALALHHKVLPPTLGVEKPNPRARFPETPFYVNTEARPWLESTQGHPRRAGVSAFGFGGTNFHVVMEEYSADLSSTRPAPSREWSDELFLWRSDSRDGLVRQLQTWEQALAGKAKPSLRDLSYTAWKNTQDKASASGSSPLQLAIVAGSLEDLTYKIGEARQSLEKSANSGINDPRGIYFSPQPQASQGKLAFLFPGQGSQYPRMLQDLLLHFPEMRNTFEQAATVLGDKLDQPLGTYVFPPPAFSREEEQARHKALTQTNIAQPALGAVSMGMFGLLGELGLQPDMVAGHSYGEYVALAAAGVIDADTLIALSEARGRFIVEGAGAEPGIMAAIEAEAGTVAAAIAKFEGVCLANANAPRQSVISGSRAAVERAVKYFASQNITARVIPVACAFHSPVVAPAQVSLAQFLATADVAEPELAVYSNTTAAPYPKQPAAITERLVEHLVRPVEFVREIESMYEAGARVFVEVGPRSVLTGLVDQILANRPKLAVASNQAGRPGLAQLLHMLGQLAAHGCSLKLDRLYRQRTERRLDLRTLEIEFTQKLGPSVWMVNGARATPLKELSIKSPLQQAKTSPARTDQNHSEEISAMRAPVSATNHAPASLTAATQSNGTTYSTHPAHSRNGESGGGPAPAPEPHTALVSTAMPSLDGAAQVMTQFQQMMTRFLDTQKTVMLAYLGGSESTAAAPQLTAPGYDAGTPVALPQAAPQVSKPEPFVAPPPAFVAEPATPPVVAPTVAAAPLPATVEAVALAPALDKAALTAQLLSIVSERTGYPTEMLDVNLDLEGDLGIDSIKRVEILGTLQQSFSANGVNTEGLIETLSGVRTLNGIIELMVERLGARPAEVLSAPAMAIALPPAQESPLPASTTLDKKALTAQLLTIVSDRTGYPPEMLDLNLDLEADLGIDSIKRVEILGTFQASFAAAGVSAGENLMETLAGIRTLQGIIDRVFEHVACAQEPPLSSRPAPLPAAATVPSGNSVERNGVQKNGTHPALAEDERIRRYTLAAVETPVSGRPRTLAKDRVILITDGGHAVARALNRDLLVEGCKVAMVRQGRSVEELEAGSYTADLTSPKSVAELVALVSQRQGALGGIVHLFALQGEANFEVHDYEGWKEQLRFGVKSLFHVAKAAGKSLRQAAAESGASLIAATGMGGSFLTDLPAEALAKFPDHGAVAGLMKTLAIEWPDVHVKAVDLDLGEDTQSLARHLLDELHAGDACVEVGYQGRRRFTLQPIQAAVVNRHPSSFRLDPSSVVLITGGARGISALAAKHLAELYQPTLVLAGRSPLPLTDEAPDTAGITAPNELKAALMNQMRARGETVTPAVVERAYARLTAEREIRSNLAALEQLGSQVHYYPVDVRDEEAFGTFIDGIYTSFGRLDGVIHGAGVIEDKLVQDKTSDSFDRVFDTKVNSAFLLSRKLRPESLKFLLFFASVAGRFGNRGQGDYASANEILNKLAVCLDRSWQGRVVAINWGPWDSNGMVSAEVRRQFAERGVELIAPAVGLRRMEQELMFGRRGESQIVIGGAGWQAPSRQTDISSWPLVGRAVLSRGEKAMEMIREIDPTYDLYLNDHRLDGQPVLPLAVATEMMLQAVAHAWPSMQVAAVRDVRVLHGVVLEGDTKSVRIVMKRQGDASSNPASVAVEVSGMGQLRRGHYRATVDLAVELPDAPPLQIAPLTDAKPFSMSLPELYQQWLFHGPLFQGIVRVDQVGPSGIKALLATSSPETWIEGRPSGQWLIDPLMFDSALQLLVLWSREHWDMTALPSGFQRYRRFKAPPSSRVLCQLRLRPNTGGQTIHSDIFFLDAATNRVLAILEDMEGACSKELNRLAVRKTLVAAAGNES